MLPTSAFHHRTDITVRASRQEYRIECTNGEGSTNIALAFRGHDCVYRKSKRSEEKGLLEIRTHKVSMPAL